MKSENITDRFLKTLQTTKENDYTESSIHQVKRCLLDYLGVALAGAEMISEKENKLLSFYGNSNGPCSVIGLNTKTDIITASLLNGLSAHTADMDDGSREGNIHPGASLFSALLPLAQNEYIDTSDFIKGVIVGYETGIRLAKSMQPSHRNFGYHATGTCGSIGVAMAVAVALKFDLNQMKCALTAACTGASGMLKATKGGSGLKPYHSAQATVTGLNAAFLARSGYTGAEDILGGKWGFLEMKAPKFEVKELFDLDNKKPAIERIYFKPYAACRHAHPVVDAILKLSAKNQIKSDSIEKVIVDTYHLATEGHDHTHIQGVTSAKMSTPFTAAITLINGKADIYEYTDQRIKDKNILNLTTKVEVRLDDEINREVPEKRAAKVSLFMKNGDVLIESVNLAKGEPENPMNDLELKQKFISLATYGRKTEYEAKKLTELILNQKLNLNALVKNI